MLGIFTIAITTFGLVAGILAFTTTVVAQGVKVGVLTCNAALSSLTGLAAVNCIFAPAGAPPQQYLGTTSLGGTTAWQVVAPTANLAPGSLAGTYKGVTGSQALVGGPGNSITLQPVNINRTSNFAIGEVSMTLTYQPAR